MKCPPNSCSANGRCLVKNKKFSCVCKPGFTGAKCETDINECESDHPCQQKCKNMHGSYKCTCDPGYIVQNIHECIDLDECLDKTTCGNNSICVNTAGSFRCQCDEGFSLDQKTQNWLENVIYIRTMYLSFIWNYSYWILAKSAVCQISGKSKNSHR